MTVSATKISLKPYRQAYEALICTSGVGKKQGLLGSAAANLNDVFLRSILKRFIKNINYECMSANEYKSGLESVYGHLPKNEKKVFFEGVIFYLESVIDLDQKAAELISRMNSLEPSRLGEPVNKEFIAKWNQYEVKASFDEIINVSCKLLDNESDYFTVTIKDIDLCDFIITVNSQSTEMDILEAKCFFTLVILPWVIKSSQHIVFCKMTDEELKGFGDIA